MIIAKRIIWALIYAYGLGFIVLRFGIETAVAILALIVSISFAKYFFIKPEKDTPQIK